MSGLSSNEVESAFATANLPNLGIQLGVIGNRM